MPRADAHLRAAEDRALARKVMRSLCRCRHREVHRCGDQATGEERVGIDPTIAARLLWLESHPLPIGRRAKIERRRAMRAAIAVPAYRSRQ
jgi:hypothetical protein